VTDADRALQPILAGPLPGRIGRLVVRQPGDEELDLYRASVDATYGSPFHAMTAQEAHDWDELIPPRNRSVVLEQGPDGIEHLLGGAGRYDTTLSLPGGRRVPVAGLTAVGVAPGAQHRGAFRALTEAHLDECRARGDAASVLMASQTPLYGRFGYGLATRTATWEIDIPAARSLAAGAPTAGSVVLEHGRGPELIDVLAEVWEQAGARRAGSLTRSPAWWERMLSPKKSWVGGGDLLVALHRTPSGACGGYALYEVDIAHGRQGLAEADITISEMVGVDAAVELDLWRFLADLPWARTLRWAYAPIDPAPMFWLTDPRQLRRMADLDFLWLRPLDLPALTESRAFAADGSVVLEVSDPRYPDLAGRFELRSADGRGSWVPTDRAAALSLSVTDLGSLWLGGAAARQLVAVRRISGDPAAAGLLDAMLAVDGPPRCLARF
jgi:predicted acetyltransferase